MALRLAVLAASAPAVLALGSDQTATGAGNVYAGYEMATNCDEHAAIAYDAKAVKSCLTAGDDDKYTGGTYSDGTSYDNWYDCALAMYEDGYNSCKSYTDGDCTTFRTLQAFSTGAIISDGKSKFYNKYDYQVDNPNEVAKMFKDYWGNWDYADEWMQNATKGRGPWANTDAWDSDGSGSMGSATNARKQATKKGAGFIVNQMYALYEYHKRAAQAKSCMEYSSTGEKCLGTTATYSMVHGWDEGWAFWAGALESGSADSGIDWPLTLAEKRASSFGTKDATYNPNGGGSRVNSKILAASQIARDALNPFDNETYAGQIAWDAWKCIEKQAFIPMIQGCVLYAYKSVHCTVTCGDEYGQMYTFCASMIPILSNADSAAATTLMSYVSPDAITSTGLSADFDTMKALIYDNLNDMGYKISDVGACTYCGDSLSDFDTSGDSSVVDYCGFAYPMDETDSSDDGDDSSSGDCDDDDDKKDGPGPAIVGVGVAMMFVGAALAVVGCVQFNKAQQAGKVPTQEMSSV